MFCDVQMGLSPLPLVQISHVVKTDLSIIKELAILCWFAAQDWVMYIALLTSLQINKLIEMMVILRAIQSPKTSFRLLLLLLAKETQPHILKL